MRVVGMRYDAEIMDLAVEAGKRVLVHATGHPAKRVAVGAGIAAVATGVDYGVYKGGELIY
jgi:hypothetical protein